MSDRRKELKLAYKLTPPPMGVYRFKNNKTGKFLIGSSMNLTGRINSFRLQLNTDTHPNKPLQSDWKVYGSDAFTYEVLETIKPAEISQDQWRNAVSQLEEKWLDKLQPYGDNGYNKQKRKATTHEN